MPEGKEEGAVIGEIGGGALVKKSWYETQGMSVLEFKTMGEGKPEKKRGYHSRGLWSKQRMW